MRKKSLGRKVIHVPWLRVADLIGLATLKGTHLQLPTVTGLPGSARLVGVWSDYGRETFALVYEDESFELVAEGCLHPELAVEWARVKATFQSLPPAP